MPNSNSSTKFFKVGNSYGFRISKQDKAKLNIEPGDTWEKIIAPDGQSITLRKRQSISPAFKQLLAETFAQNRSLMERLKDE